MIRYIPIGCNKCDFSESRIDHCHREGMCNSYEEAYIKSDVECNIGFASLEEFNKEYGTNWKE